MDKKENHLALGLEPHEVLMGSDLKLVHVNCTAQLRAICTPVDDVLKSSTLASPGHAFLSSQLRRRSLLSHNSC